MTPGKIKDEFNEEEGKLRKVIKRAFIIATALFLVMIVLTYLVPGNNMLSILEGRFVSSSIDEDFTVTLDNGRKVIFSNGVYKELKQIYFKEQKNEFKVCLIGNKIQNNYYINKLGTPRIISQDVFSVYAEQCSKETLIPLHSHPFKHCIFSSQDIKSYEIFKEINKDAILGLMCEPARFSFYGD
ncbi:MAG TPA: hypothetical protein VJJ53_01145 [Candidatus Nanoarchaeia archaeon]|nr:hypothetical protein [Candidatus Nanoarchaeia archaeon]